MMVLCEKCNNHYDDQKQVPDCWGPGRSSKADLINLVGHGYFQPSPVEVHMAAMKAISNGEKITNGRMVYRP